MTTANLSVGIDTKPAKESLKELKLWMAQDMTVDVAIDPTTIEKSIKTYLSRRKFNVQVGTKKLAEDVAGEIGDQVDRVLLLEKRKVNYNQAALLGQLNRNIKAAFEVKNRHIWFDRNNLTLGVRKAIYEGMSTQGGFKVDVNEAHITAQVSRGIDAGVLAAKAIPSVSPGVVASASATGMGIAATSQVVDAVRMAMQPLSEEIGKAAALMAGAARKTTDVADSARKAKETTTSKDGTRASVNASTRLPDGRTVRYSTPLEAEDAVSARQMINASVQQSEDIKKQRQIDKAWEAWNKSNAGPSVESAFKSAERDQKASLSTRGKLEAQHTAALKAEIKERLAAQRSAEVQGIDNAKQFFKAQEEAIKEFKKQKQDNLKSSVSAGSREIADMRKSQAARDKAWETIEAAQAKSKSQAWTLAESESKSLAATRSKLESDHTQRLKEQIRKRLADQREANKRGTDAAKQYFKSQEDSIKALAAEQAKLNKLAAEFGPDRGVRARLEGPYKKRLAAERDLELKTRLARYEEEATSTYKGRGVKIAAAQRLASDSDTSRAEVSRLLGPASARLDVTDLSKYLIEAKKVSDTTKQTGDHVKEAISKTRELTEQKRRLAESVREVRDGVRGVAGSMGAMWLTWGSLAPLAAGAAIGAMLRSVYMNGKELEYQLKFVSVLTGEAVVNIDTFADSVRGSQSGAIEAAKAMRALAQNGLSTRDSLMALPDVLNLATAGEMDFAAAALGATGVMEAFNMRVTELSRVSDVFAKAAAMSNTDVASMVEAMKQASTVSDKYKVSLEETAASLAVLAKRNITGSAAGTAFRNMMVELATPTEKARNAMKKMNLELYDSNNQLKSYPEVMEQLEKVLFSLNEKGRLNFLNEMFNERGVKAASNLISDYKKLGQMTKELKTEAAGFTREVSEALAETTTGKLKKLTTEYELATSKAFKTTSDSLGVLIDTIRRDIGSDGFQGFLVGLSNLGLRVSEAAYSASAGIGLLAAGLVSLKIAAPLVTTAAAAMNVQLAASRLLFVTTPLGMVISLTAALAGAMAYMAAKSNDATRAVQAKNNALYNAIETINNENKSIDAKLKLLREELVLLRQGKTLAEAKAEAEAKIEKAKNQVDRVKATTRLAQLGVDKTTVGTFIKGGQSLPITANRRADGKPLSAAELNERQGLLDQLRTLDLLDLKAYTRSVGRKEVDDGNELSKALGAFNKANEDNIRANKELKQFKNNPLPTYPNIDRGKLSLDEIRSLTEEMTTARSLRSAGFERADPAAASAATSLENAQVTALFKELDQLQSRTRTKNSLNNKLDEVTFPSDLFGKGSAAIISEERANREISQSIASQETIISRIEEFLKNAKNLKEPDLVKLNSRLAEEKNQIAYNREDGEVQRKINALIRSNAVSSDSREFQKKLTDLGVDSDNANLKLREPLRKTMSARDQAVAAAQAAEEQRYSSIIAEQRLKIKNSEEGIALLREKQKNASEEDIAKANEGIRLLEIEKSSEEGKLAILVAQAKAKAQMAGGTAGEVFDETQSAEYGFRKFWEEYQASAQSAAMTVESIMKSTTSSMTDMWMGFITTGKMGFSSFARSVIADAARIMANEATRRLLGMAINFAMNFFGGSGNTVSSSDASAGLFQGSGATNFANGGVMTSAGPIELRRYASGGMDGGGITNRPRLSLVGEWTKPEAYVPLPDGRTIPVTLTGAASGGGSVQVNVAVHIDGNGGSQVQSDASGEKARELGAMVGSLVSERLLIEQRPGGILYKAR